MELKSTVGEAEVSVLNQPQGGGRRLLKECVYNEKSWRQKVGEPQEEQRKRILGRKLSSGSGREVGGTEKCVSGGRVWCGRCISQCQTMQVKPDMDWRCSIERSLLLKHFQWSCGK